MKHTFLTLEADQLNRAGKKTAALRKFIEAQILSKSSTIESKIQALIATSTPFPSLWTAIEQLFDPDYYLAAYPDLNRAGVDPLVHYLIFGWKEDRNPSQHFNAAYYRECNPDLGSDVFPLAHYLETGGGRAKRGNPVSDALWFITKAPADDAWNTLTSARRQASTEMAVIIPVYKGYDETLCAIFHAVQSRGSAPYSLLVINDRSPDPALTAKLQELSKLGLFDYSENPENLGFVRTINRSLTELCSDLDVILLNSDAYVFPGWYERLAAHVARHPDAATITPLSNNATICSYPEVNQDNNMALELPPAALDQLAAGANQGLSTEVPTGIGFCFYMRRSVIEQIGVLDEKAFKIGYGEENDFCMRALHAGYKNLAIGDVFVFHSGSVSFTGIRNENFDKGQNALAEKHPNYGQLVRNHIEADPERYLRRRLDAARLHQKMKGCTVFVTHKWAGGIETYLHEEKKRLNKEGRGYIVLRVHDLYQVSVETDLVKGLFVPNLKNIDLRYDLNFVEDLLRGLQSSEINVNSFAGLSWQWHKAMLELISALERPIIYIGHDYSSISHYYQLMRPDNVIQTTLPTIAELREWGKMQDHTGSADVCDPEERQQVYRSFLDRVSKIIVPSNAARSVLLNYFPELDIIVVPHEDHLPDTKKAVRREKDGLLRIAVVGAIGAPKGYDILQGLAADAQNRNLPIEYHLIGYSQNDELLNQSGVILHGRFKEEKEALNILDEIQPDLFFIPSVWPETFCYTLSMALKKSIPPVVFNIGAQGERVTNLDWGHVLPLDLAANPRVLSKGLASLQIE
ncbi:glycosyltransferase [Roseibium litorale]|uniref:Glycosyltransferase n=1 Tax=Roseibium litorale TaxID=2803841 RepID=A0ABR9CU43_9HYPH|nr:glycosyltransferase [Roseibium litorale]MBD8894273.1 glycosyltransferase [Roseibium litorale]